MKSYILSVICAAFLCAICSGMVQKKGSSAMILKLVSGIFLALTVIRPIANVELRDLEHLIPDISANAAFASDMGKTYANDQRSAIIKAETEAYILDKARELGTDLTADVSLDKNNIPDSVMLRGQITQRAKETLTRILEQDLAIPKEDQIWNVS